MATESALQSSSSSSSTTEFAPVFNVSDPKSTLISINMSNITKLTATNFITWSLQVGSLLEAYDLHCFIDDEIQAPSETTLTETGTTQPNPNFAAWKRQDKMLYSSLIGSLSLSIQPVVARATTSRELWQILTQTYGKPSRGHIKQLKQQLKRSNKGTKSINDYMRGIIDKSDQLALLGSPLDHEDLLDIIIDGLGDDYRAIVEMVNGRDVPITVDELHEKLINRENTLTATAEIDISSVPITANATQFRQQTQRSFSNSRGGFSSSRGGFSARGGFRPPRPYLGKCQICGTQGHSARRCPQYQSVSAPSQYALPPTMQVRAPPPGFAPLPPSHWQHQAHHVTTSSPDISPWLLDSAASHHIASDLSNLSLHSPYQGNESVMIGNGTGLQITHTGEGSQHGDNTSQRQGQ